MGIFGLKIYNLATLGDVTAAGKKTSVKRFFRLRSLEMGNE
jgi:hypothetical protein